MAATPQTTDIPATGEQFYENTEKYTLFIHVTDKLGYKSMHHCIKYTSAYLKIS